MLKELDIHTFCQAFLFQSALENEKANESSAYKYVFIPPASFFILLKAAICASTH